MVAPNDRPLVKRLPSFLVDRDFVIQTCPVSRPPRLPRPSRWISGTRGTRAFSNSSPEGIKHGIKASRVPSTLLLDGHTCHPTLVLLPSQRDAITSRRESGYRLTGVTQASLSALSEPSGLVPGAERGPSPLPRSGPALAWLTH